MARVLIVGCGCRGTALGAALVGDGHAVRGTSRTEEGRARIEAAGMEGAVADPDRLGTVLAQLEGASVVVWLMGSAESGAEALHGPRLEAMLERLVDTPVRGMAYEAAGTVDAGLLAQGARLTRDAGDRWSMPVAVVEADPGDVEGWTSAMRAAVAALLA